MWMLRGKERGHDLSGPFSVASDAETGVGPYRFSMSHQLRPREWPREGVATAPVPPLAILHTAFTASNKHGNVVRLPDDRMTSVYSCIYAPSIAISQSSMTSGAYLVLVYIGLHIAYIVLKCPPYTKIFIVPH